MRYRVVDDTGALLALVDPAAYDGFVDGTFDVDRVSSRVREEMERYAILAWHSGCEELWTIEISFEKLNVKGLREAKGTITSAEGSLFLASWADIALFAIYPDFREYCIPFTWKSELYIKCDPGRYNARIIQMFEPDADIYDKDGTNPLSMANTSPHYYIELTKSDQNLPAWTQIAWTT